MKKNIKIHFSDGERETTKVNIETVCPHCGIPVDPTILCVESNYLKSELFGTFGVFLSCTNKECRKYHVQAFNYKRHSSHTSIEVGQKIPYTYRVKLKNSLPNIVNNTFPSFKEIYEQSLEAEAQGLDQIAGIGYRKAIEFLIKLYVIHKQPENEEDVKSKFLGKVIDNNLTEFPKIQTLAKAAVWIGNDETHFVRVHDDKDIQDMKEFLTATALFISAELQVEEALEFTNRPRT